MTRFEGRMTSVSSQSGQGERPPWLAAWDRIGPRLPGGNRKRKGVPQEDKDAVTPFDVAGMTSLFQEIPVGCLVDPGGFVAVRLSGAEREQLQKWARSRTVSHRIVIRCRIVLLKSRGLSVNAIAAYLRVSPTTVRLWCKRFERHGVAALIREAPGGGRPLGRSREAELAVLRATRACAPALSVRRVAAHANTCAATVWRVWRRHTIARGASVDSIDAKVRQGISETAKSCE
jgi:transposase